MTPGFVWIDLGEVEAFAPGSVHEVVHGGRSYAVIRREDVFSVLTGECPHLNGPLGRGALAGDHLVCPEHFWRFHWQTGEADSGRAEDCLERFEVKVEGGRVWSRLHDAEAVSSDRDTHV